MRKILALLILGAAGALTGAAAPWYQYEGSLRGL